MVKSIWVNNFKSLVNFKMELTHFTCLVGLNGAGKSTVLQSIDFVAQLVKGDIKGWLKEKRWDAEALTSKLEERSLISFIIVISGREDEEFHWIVDFDVNSLKCISEKIITRRNGKELQVLLLTENSLVISSSMESDEGKLVENDSIPIIFEYQGSILSSIKESELSEDVQFVKNNILRFNSLELLSPGLMRARVKNPHGVLGRKGEKLAHFIDTSGPEGREELKRGLASVYAQLSKIDTHRNIEGWIDLNVTEEFEGEEVISSVDHINDGMLRFMAMFSFLRYYSEKLSFLMFDEIENGINPELIEFLVDHLVAAKSQILITTHSPLVLNYLEDDVAKRGVVYLYKDTKGRTQSIRLFDIPSLRKKLDFMGPGEAFVDTDLIRLQEEILSYSSER